METFSEAVRDHPTRFAVVDGKGERTTYGELVEHAASLAARWEHAGFPTGGRAVLAAPLGADLFAALAAVWMLRGSVVLSEPATGLAGLRHAAEASGADAYLSSGLLYGALRWIVPELRRLSRHLRVKAYDRKWQVDARRGEPDDPALISFTSGSTGRPKAIVRTQGFLAGQDAALGTLLAHGDDGGADLVAFPVFVLANLRKGRTSVLPPWNVRRHAELDPGKTAAFMDVHGVTRMLVPPAALERMLEAPPPCRLRTIITGGGPVFPDLVERLLAWKPGLEVVSCYGSTEAEPIAHVSSSNAHPPENKGIYAGRPAAPAVVRIRDGEIQVAGPHVVQGYLDPTDDASTKVRENGTIWHRTGDAGRLDDDGLWLLGRLGAEVGGVHPFVAEAQARSWPGIRHAALGRVGAAAVLAVTCDPGSEGTWNELARMTGVERVVRLGSIPMDKRHGSKVDRKALDGMLAARVA